MDVDSACVNDMYQSHAFGLHSCDIRIFRLVDYVVQIVVVQSVV